ncbi:TIGR02678 family protein [Actinomadura rupiterrae]|uniref:TIGR02678 family protein n=1 Tax=Actinomadura rupiterrae TaxID=559627 RepID=UPI0020A599DC|nr:TIGR02678 family protein [Actinomadura rupiterrae]MCP2342993.1 uncharacterized protein (TIGR02678 family) [Actinomadura rupiterrae]
MAALLRVLAARPWLVSGRDDALISAVRRNEGRLRTVYGRLGWVLFVSRDLVRLRKSPPPRRDSWAARAPNSLVCAWFFVLAATAESMPPKVALPHFVTEARVAAAEAGVPSTGEIDERRAIVAAFKLLDERGVVVCLDGDIERYVHDDKAPVLLAVHHVRLTHLIANAGGSDPAADPGAWLDGVEHESDPARRMRRRLVDDTVVHACDLDDAEADWLRRRVRGDDGAPLAEAFGLAVERRAEGAAFVVPEDAYRHPRELGPVPFPITGGTVPHAALLLCDAAGTDGRPAVEAGVPQGAPGPGWHGLSGASVIDRLSDWSATVGAGRGGWSKDLVENPGALAVQVADLLTALDLVRIVSVGAEHAVWWFSPVTGRWPAPAAEPARPKSQPRDAVGMFTETGEVI